MTPRLKESKKWTVLPPELKTQIVEVFAKNFEKSAKLGTFFVEGRIYGTELLVSIGYLEKGRLRQVNFEVSVGFNPRKQNALAMIHLAVDCAASLFHEYFDQDQDLSEFPIVWTEFETEEGEVFVRTSTINTELEEQANRLLGFTDDHLVQDAAEDSADENDPLDVTNEDRNYVNSMLGLDKNDLEQNSDENEDLQPEENEKLESENPKKTKSEKKTIH